MQDRYWLLPDGIEEIEPQKARELELLRRRLLDNFCAEGYAYILLPQLEFLHSLLFKPSEDLENKTFKVTDRLSGELLGFSPDATIQVAKYDAKYVDGDNLSLIKKYSYCHQIFHTLPYRQFASRAPLQLGAEIFGDSGIAGDWEVLQLMVETLTRANISNLHLDLGHAGIFKHLSNKANLNEMQRKNIFLAIQQKRFDELDAFLATIKDSHAREAKLLAKLPHLSGGYKVMEEANRTLGGYDGVIDRALNELEQIIALIRSELNVKIYLDLGELRSYNYHTGLVFAAYVDGMGQSLAKGGRYDNICKNLGIYRAATGFSLDLKLIASLANI